VQKCVVILQVMDEADRILNMDFEQEVSLMFSFHLVSVLDLFQVHDIHKCWVSEK